MSYTFDADIVSDLHKDARGFRPREGFWGHWNLSTSDEKQAIWDGLLRELDERFAEDQRREREAVSRFDSGLELIQATFACDREEAIVHFVESLKLDKYDLMYGRSYICFDLGLPYSMEKEFEPAIKALLAKMEVEA